MTYDIEELKREIRVCLDQNMVSTPLTVLGDVDMDTLSLDDMIESKIADATLFIEREAPRYMLDGGKPFSGDIAWEESPWEEDYKKGRIALPDDFIRLISFKMSDWQRAVTDVISEDDPRYEQMQSRFPGIAGSPQSPVCALAHDSESGDNRLVLEFCSSAEESKVSRAMYLPMPVIDGTEIDISEKLKDAVVYYAAYLTAMGIGQENAEYFLNTSRTLAGIS